MSRKLHVLALACIYLIGLSLVVEPVKADGGVNCAACTIIVHILGQVAEIQSIPIDKLLDDICSWFPAPIDEPCQKLVDQFGPAIIALLVDKTPPDDVCHAIKFCSDPTCRLFPQQGAGRTLQSTGSDPRFKKLGGYKNWDSTMKFSPWDWLKQLINRLGNEHEPIVDLDDDLFSSATTLRGASWRGRDCNDMDAASYPGRVEDGQYDPQHDQNCNGIFGVSPTGQPYEQMLCENSGARGIAILGDSAAAHFSIPARYLNASEIHKGTYDDLLFLLENEFDWPQRSAVTGYEKATPDSGPMDSLYLRLRDLNRCNHRDYQNIGVNGARVGAMAPPQGIINSLARNQTLDKPLLVVYSLIGNDVCNGHHTLDTMTKLPDFYNSVVKALDYLDTVLPRGSHVIFTGMVDGRILWDSMHNRTHPIGGVDYAGVYAYLNCLEISPCWVWLNDNETIRNAGSARAAELSTAYGMIMSNHTYKNFDMAYYDYPLPEVVEKWKAMGGESWELIEPVDGFHPNQITNALFAEVLWTHISADHPEFLGDANPNNVLIDALFGDQGGY